MSVVKVTKLDNASHILLANLNKCSTPYLMTLGFAVLEELKGRQKRNKKLLTRKIQ